MIEKERELCIEALNTIKAADKMYGDALKNLVESGHPWTGPIRERFDLKLATLKSELYIYSHVLIAALEEKIKADSRSTSACAAES